MKKCASLIVLAGIVAMSSCADTGPNQQRGAVVGGLGGAGVGAVIGHQSGNAATGALIGGATGALVGGAVGKNKDKKQGY